MPSSKKSGSFNKQREIEKKRRKNRKKRLIIFILLAIILGTILYFLNSPTFKIKNVEVTGNAQLDSEKIIEQSEIKIGESIFANFNIITKVKVKQNRYIEDAIVSKKMPDTIKIEVKERIASFQVKTESGYYIYIDDQGYIIEYSQEPRELITIVGMDITEENIENKKRLEDDDLNIKL